MKVSLFTNIWKLLKKYYKYSIFIVLSTLTYYILINLGFFFDISKEDKNTDLLLCLGGGNGERVSRTIEIYNKYKLYSPKILLTDNNNTVLNNKKNLLLQSNIPLQNIIIISKLENTYSELKVAHKLMVENGYKSVNIISDEPHTRRINILINNFIRTKNDNFLYNIVGSKVKWWNKKYYYKNKKRAVYFVVHESVKIIHNLFYYSYIKYFNIEDKNCNIKNNYEEEVTIKINKIITYILSI